MSTRLRAPVNVALLKLLEETTLDGNLIASWETKRAGRSTHLAVLLADLAKDQEVLAVRVAGQETALELLHVAIANLGCLSHRVAQGRSLIALLTPSLEHVARDCVRASLSRPVDRTVLEVHETSLAVRRLQLTRGWEAQPARGAAQTVVLSQNRAEQRMRTSLRRPERRTTTEVLRTTMLRHHVLIIHTITDDTGLGRLSNRTNRRTLRTAITLRQVQRIRNVRPRLRHLELPVLPRVHTRRTELHDRLDVGAVGVVHKRLRRQAGNNLKALTRRVCRALSH